MVNNLQSLKHVACGPDASFSRHHRKSFEFYPAYPALFPSLGTDATMLWQLSGKTQGPGKIKKPQTNNSGVRVCQPVSSGNTVQAGGQFFNLFLCPASSGSLNFSCGKYVPSLHTTRFRFMHDAWKRMVG